MIYVENNPNKYQNVYIPRTTIVTGGTYNPFDPTNYWTSGETQDAINEATSGKADSSAVTVEIQEAVSGLAESSAVTQQISEATSGKADSSAVTEEIQEALSSYTPTSGFTTINGSAITEGGNIDVSPSYSAGTNIDITDNTISVTGITIPTSNTAFTNDAGYITEDALSGYAESSAVTQEINQAVSGKADSSAVTQEIQNAVSGLAESSAVTAEISAATSGLAESSAVTQEIQNAVSGLQETLSAGTNIDITNNTISVTGITIPTSNTAFTNDAGYITQDALSGYAESSAVTAEISAATSGLAESSAVTQEIQNAVSGLAESSAVTQEIQNAVSGLAESSAVTQEINQAVSGLAESSAVTAEISAATSGLAESSAVTAEISAATSGLAESSAVTQEINTALSSYTPTSGFSTINGSAITSGGNITISGGSAGAVEMTQAEYNALSGNVSADTFYVISDATPINMSDYATTGALATTATTLSGAIDTKATKASTTARSGSYFPYWNAEGIITGDTQAYSKTHNVNGTNYNVYSSSNTNWPTIYAPTSTGTSGNLCVSSGSGAPTWKTILAALGVDFWVGSQTDYDNMNSHSATTLYIIDPTL